MERFLKSRFKTGPKIGENPFSLTYRGTFLSGEKPVIIKIYKRGTLNSALIKNMKAKVKLLSEMDHPGIARLYDGDYGWQGFYYVREFVEGRTLGEILQGGKAELFDADRIIGLVCEALLIPHRAGLVHGAIKPENVFILANGQIKLADFTIEGEVKEALPQKAVVVLSRSQFMSPEEILGDVARASSDIYSVGLLYYALLSGILDFPPARKLNGALPPPPGLPKYAEDVLDKALQPDPLLRFRTIDDFLQSLKQKTLVEKREALDFPPIELENRPPLEAQEVVVVRQERKRSFFLLIVIGLSIAAGLIYMLIMRSCVNY
ncbi:MAG: serine/threonine-protein kinase [Candidatus Margulisiibacteriota bacterium]